MSQVTNIWNGDKMFSAFQSNNDEQDTANFELDAPGMGEVVAIAALNSRIKFDKTDVPFNKREIMGDATETGLSRFAGRYLPDYDAYLKAHPKVFEVPFNSTNKWALVIVRASVRCAKCRSLTVGCGCDWDWRGCRLIAPMTRACSRRTSRARPSACSRSAPRT